MSDLARHAGLLPATNEPLRVAIRRMRWFRAAFRRYLDHLERELGARYEIDDARLAAVFVRWLRKVEAQKPRDPAARRSFFEFSAGLMLREMTADMPVRVAQAPTRAAGDGAAAFWPEGYACTMFCIAVTSAAVAQEFQAETQTTPALHDLRHWWSFRENAAEDPRVSIGFLDTLIGNEPDWSMPEIFARRLRREIGPDDPASRLGAGG
jgi:hypothetical protein